MRTSFWWLRGQHINLKLGVCACVSVPIVGVEFSFHGILPSSFLMNFLVKFIIIFKVKWPSHLKKCTIIPSSAFFHYNIISWDRVNS